VNPDGVERKLAAILSADVVGYSRLMAEDEAGTIRTLTAYREAISMLVRQHRGRVVDSPGDNILAEFPTALDAVQGAVEIQRVIQARNADLPIERRMEFRIGVHMGDVSVESDRLYGDGVNIAARLEGLAKAGGVCISATVYEQVEKKLNVDLEDLGEQTLKNIARPVHVYGMKLVLPVTGHEEPDKALPGMDDLTVPGFGGRSAIAVLAFDSLSGDPAQEYFADGIAENLITRLSSFLWHPVIARNSSFVYKGQAVDVKRVSRELGARYVVEGSVQKAGDRVRISAQLIDAATGRHIWAEQYDRQLEDVFGIQDDITEAIAASVAPELVQSDTKRALRQQPQDLDAWDSYWRAWWHFRRYSKDGHAEARSLFQRAFELDPSFTWALAGLAITHQEDVGNQWSESPAHSLSEAEQAVRTAMALDDADPFVYYALGCQHVRMGQPDKAVAAFERALQLNPSYHYALYMLGAVLATSGKPDEGIENIETAIRLSPKDTFCYLFFNAMSLAHAAAGRSEAAVHWAQQARLANPDFPMPYLSLAANYAALGRMDEARTAMLEALRLNPALSLTGIKAALAGSDPSFAETALENLRKAGLKE
jgi:adenylate cyclase